MVHPFRVYPEATQIEDMELITVTLEMCTLYKGVPHGMALISHTDPQDADVTKARLSFRGLGIFRHGVLHNTPFSCAGRSQAFAKMFLGRPAPGSFHTYFYPDGREEPVHSFEEMSNVGGQ